MERHKARLNAELTRLRLKRRAADIEELKNTVVKRTPRPLTDGHTPENRSGTTQITHPRWVRVNTLKTTLHEELESGAFAGYTRVDSLIELEDDHVEKSLYVDENIPNLIALPTSTDLTRSPAYLAGTVILQDKASCFPAYLLNLNATDGNIVDACAAPGNKTTHLAAILHGKAAGKTKQVIHAFEKDKSRAQSLYQMVQTAGAEQSVMIHPGQNFLKLKPTQLPWNKVHALLLDPSCSGSGIVRRDEALQVTLPQRHSTTQASGSKKRKRPTPKTSVSLPQSTPEEEPQPALAAKDLSIRLTALSKFQVALLLHAFTFPAARKITYSTCSIYAEENEHVVMCALTSPTAKETGWRILKREEQVKGMRIWHLRGDREACNDFNSERQLHLVDDDLESVSQGCIRCAKGTSDGTQGFFVAGFVREADENEIEKKTEEEEEAEWEGLSDEGG